MKPDLSAKGFSALNAFFFSGMSKIAYATEDEARGLLVGNSTNAGLGFDRFFWFEVCGMCTVSCTRVILRPILGT